MESQRDGDMEQGFDLATWLSRQQGFDLAAWLSRHGSKEARPPLDKVIEALKAEGIDTFGATGYCLGGMFLSFSLRGFVAFVAISHL